MADEDEDNMFNAMRAFKKARLRANEHTSEAPERQKSSPHNKQSSDSDSSYNTTLSNEKSHSSSPGGASGTTFYTALEPTEQLPGFEESLRNTDLRFKREHAKLVEEERKLVLAKAEEAAKKEETAPKPTGSVYALPEITWHVPMTSFDYLKEEEEKKHRTMKDKERTKRGREGQSSQSTWKSETFMKLRQQFD